MRFEPLTSFTPPALRVHELAQVKQSIADPPVVAQTALDGERNVPPAYLLVRLLGTRCRLLRQADVAFTHMHGDARLQHLQVALHDDALEELHVTSVILGERENRRAGRREEVLEVLLAPVQQLQPRLVR